MKIRILTLTLATCFSVATQLQAQDLRITSADLFARTLETTKDCIEYCVDGLSLYMIIRPWGIRFYWTPNVSHNSPDILLMSHNELHGSPYSDFNRYFGAAYRKMSEKLMQLATGIKSPIGGGRYLYDEYGPHQTVNFKEATGIGHPASVLLKMFNRRGLKPKGYKIGKTWIPCKTNGCLENEQTTLSNSLNQELRHGSEIKASLEERLKDAEIFLAKYPGHTSQNTSVIMMQNFGGSIKNMDTVAGNQELNQTIQNIGSRVAKFGSVRSRIFCPINITPFIPYYLSGMDGIQWRAGYPLTDPHKSAQILNPVSSDKIGKKNELWGHIYPREGAVNHGVDAKVGTVIAVRAADILNEGKKNIRIVNKPPESNKGFGGWGKVYPEKNICHKKAENTGTKHDKNGGYGWTYWRRYNCDLRTEGIHITTIKFGPICLTPRVPE